MSAAHESGSFPFRGSVEFAPGFRPHTGLRHVLFDFDGTLSLIREGWPDVMVPLFVEMLPPAADESDADREALVRDDIMRLTGKQTIYQMIQLAERIRERGGTPAEPLWYKQEYLRRLDARINSRVEGLRTGRILPEELLVHGARTLLDHLRTSGLVLHLASGTDEPFVRQEADLLGLTHDFASIGGARDDYQDFSKRKVIASILQEHDIPGTSLLAFGDGYVEIEETKRVGGLAIAVATDEAANGAGRVDVWKRERLLQAGADVVIPDYRDALALLGVLTDRTIE